MFQASIVQHVTFNDLGQTIEIVVILNVLFGFFFIVVKFQRLLDFWLIHLSQVSFGEHLDGSWNKKPIINNPTGTFADHETYICCSTLNTVEPSNPDAWIVSKCGIVARVPEHSPSGGSRLPVSWNGRYSVFQNLS